MRDLLPKDCWGYDFPAAGEILLSFFSFIGTDKKQSNRERLCMCSIWSSVLRNDSSKNYPIGKVSNKLRVHQ